MDTNEQTAEIMTRDTCVASTSVDTATSYAVRVAPPTGAITPSSVDKHVSPIVLLKKIDMSAFLHQAPTVDEHLHHEEVLKNTDKLKKLTDLHKDAAHSSIVKYLSPRVLLERIDVEAFSQVPTVDEHLHSKKLSKKLKKDQNSAGLHKDIDSSIAKHFSPKVLLEKIDSSKYKSSADLQKDGNSKYSTPVTSVMAPVIEARPDTINATPALLVGDYNARDTKSTHHYKTPILNTTFIKDKTVIKSPTKKDHISKELSSVNYTDKKIHAMVTRSGSKRKSSENNEGEISTRRSKKKKLVIVSSASSTKAFPTRHPVSMIFCLLY